MIALTLTTIAVVATVYAIAATHKMRAPAARSRPTARLLWHPLTQWFAVCALLFVNQLLCNAYIIRFHHGDPSFVTQYLGRGWFAIARGGPIESIADAIGNAPWLAVTVLRVQAFLELPFTLFAYLAVARLLGRGVHRQLVQPRLLIAAAVTFTVTFSVVEIMLWNPWTVDDLIMRGIACVIAPLWVIGAARREGGDDDEAMPRGLFGVVVFLVGAGAIAYLVLAVYDAFLLYNLAHLERYAPAGAAAVAAAIIASWCAPRVDRIGSGGPAVAALVAALARFTVVFFVPSLALRYRAADPIVIAAGGAVIATVAFDVRNQWRGQLGLAALAVSGGGIAGSAAAFAIPSQFREGKLACFALATLVTAATVLALGDAFNRRRSLSTASDRSRTPATPRDRAARHE